MVELLEGVVKIPAFASGKECSVPVRSVQCGSDGRLWEDEMMPGSKDRILDAAERVVLRDGVTHLTLDAVAAETGISKGGLLYHFPSKRRFPRR
jgi:hypothetical protein